MAQDRYGLYPGEPDIQEAADRGMVSTCRLYGDEAHLSPAGSAKTTTSPDGVWPRVETQDYAFEAGAMAGSRGTSRATTSQDGASQSEFETTCPDGTRTKGNSRRSPSGALSWRSEWHRPDGASGTVEGEVGPDGSGEMRTRTSDGTSAVFRLNADGSGTGQVTGNGPSLPARIERRADGSSKTTPADGTATEFAPPKPPTAATS